MAEIPQVCNALHLPFQAGSDRILKLMDRGYTKEEYIEKIEKVKDRIKDIALSTDIIVGFPTETEDDFLHTLDVVERVKFEQIFSFKFSPRPGTPAYDMEGQVPDEVKRDRMERLLNLQKKIMGEICKRYEGTVQEVLLEDTENGNKLIGRSTTNKWVSVEGGKELLGKIVKVRIEKSSPYNMSGEVVEVMA